MLDLATGLIERTLAKLIGRGIDISTKTVGQKRSLLSSVLGLYEALAELETASWRTYKTFARWAEEKGRATKVVLKARLQAIREATDKYDKYLQESGRALEIYDRDLTLILRGTGSPKRANIARLALMISALPDQALDGERLTTRVYYPSGLPDISDIQTNYPHLHYAELADKAKEVERVLAERFHQCVLDVDDPKQLSEALARERIIIERLGMMRERLAEFIRLNLPLDKVLSVNPGE